MIITITGEPGSGKSTIGKKLAEKLDYERIYMGQIYRDTAKQKGMTVAEFSKYTQDHPETDFEIDEYQQKLGQKKDNFIIEGRTSWFLIPHSIKLYITVAPLTGARRVHNELQSENSRNEDRKIDTVEDILDSHKRRMESDKQRYLKYYQKDCFNKKNFDFVIDTTDLTPDEVFQQIWKYIESKIK